MKGYLPDTNILIDALLGRRDQNELLAGLVRQGHQLGCCAVTVAELFAGARDEDISKVQTFISSLKWHEARPAISKRAGRWRFQYKKQGFTLALADLLIAATAVEYNLTLITNNKKHFPMPELSMHP